MPTINAVLNTACTVCLSLGYVAIRRQRRQVHKRWMLTAVSLSCAFLICYAVYHIRVGSVPYPLFDWTRPLYFVVLVPHIVLAAVSAPFILLLLSHALRGHFDRHATLARRIWPVWIFVSVSGVIVYLMLYQWAGAAAT